MKGTDSRTMSGRTKANGQSTRPRSDEARSRQTIDARGRRVLRRLPERRCARSPRIAQQHHRMGRAHQAQGAERCRQRPRGRDDHPPGEAAARARQRSRRHVAPAVGQSPVEARARRCQRAGECGGVCGEGNQQQECRVRFSARSPPCAAARRWRAASPGIDRACSTARSILRRKKEPSRSA